MSRVRALVVLFLLASGSLLALVPPSAAQTPALLCLDRDPRVAGACTTRSPPDYEQGSKIGITLEPFVGAPTWISVRCDAGCPAGDPSATRVYWAAYRGTRLNFPDDFVDPGPQNDGGNAVLDRTPRYNSTWLVTAHTPTPIEREANVWLYNGFIDANDSIRPGAEYLLRATGFDANVDVTHKWERRSTTGNYELVDSLRGRSNAAGAYESYFQFPRTEARRIVECGADRFTCYRLVVEGAGKQREIVHVQVDVADVVRSEATTPRPGPGEQVAFERSDNATFAVDLYYPGGRVRQGPKLVAADAPDSISFGGKALRVAVERMRELDGDDEFLLIDEVPLRFDENALLWRATWSIPKDLEDFENTDYRLRLVDQRDAYGNRVPSDVLGNFTVTEAVLDLRVVESFAQLRRTEPGTVRLAIQYHNGTPVTRDDVVNDSPFAGCFVRMPDPPPEGTPPQPQFQSCIGRNLTWATYHEGAWNFTVKYARDYADLTSHRFILDDADQGEMQDKYGNTLPLGSLAPFTVVPASPEVEFHTVARGEEAEVLERGTRVFVSATIRYHDGTPYNHLVRPDPDTANASILRGTLLRRGPAAPGSQYGPLASEEPFELTLTDASIGRWSGVLQLTDDDTNTPVGNWTFRFDIADNVSVPNRNLSLDDREVVSSLIRLCPTFQPSQSVPTGSTIRFRFRLYYSECDTGREVPVGAIESRIQAKVHRYSPANASAAGVAVSNVIIPSFGRDGSRDWGLEYVVPNELFSGSYRLVFTGADAYGNRLVPSSFSQPFTTFTDVVLRSVISEPPADVRRGDSATVVFDAREGDIGVDPVRGVRIQLERFDAGATTCATASSEGGCWVRERADVRVPDETFEDHVGVFPISIDTPVGLYRFSLQGRDATYRIITGLSSNFSVNPTEVTRPLLVPPPERIVKGEAFTFYVENLAGDKFEQRIAFLNGRAFTMPLPTLRTEGVRVNVTWSIPFESPTGNYTLRLIGRDVSGNIISVITPPIEATAASLEGRLLGQPARVVERGQEARILFGVAYPDQGFYAAPESPRVYVLNKAGATVDEARVLREGLTFAASWRPGVETPIGEYAFEVSPQATGATGNLFPPLRSGLFRLVPGVVTRNPVDDIGAEFERTVDAAFTVPFAADDKFVGFELVYYGPRLTTQVDTTTTLPEVTRTPLAHTLDAASSKYVARLDTDSSTQIGTYRIVMTGEDGAGNRLSAQSRLFVIRPTTIIISPRNVPPTDAFGEGKTITFNFLISYRGGTVMDDTMGRPSAALLWNGRPVAQRPEVEFVGGMWIATWTAPDTLPPGEYTFTMGGADSLGNPLTTFRSTPFPVLEGSLPESFAKVVPGPSPVFLGLVLALAAVLLVRRKR